MTWIPLEAIIQLLDMEEQMEDIQHSPPLCPTAFILILLSGEKFVSLTQETLKVPSETVLLGVMSIWSHSLLKLKILVPINILHIWWY